MGTAAVFVDRDGVINANRADHVLDWSQFEFLPGVLSALSLLAANGMPVIVLTNQAVIARGLLSVPALAEIHRRMRASICAAGGDVRDVLYCPHDAAAGCACRKPQPGLFFEAARLHDIDLAASYYVGDALTDLQAGQAAGCTCILVRTGRGRPQQVRDDARLIRGYYAARDLQAAARWIVTRAGDASVVRHRAPWWRALVPSAAGIERW